MRPHVSGTERVGFSKQDARGNLVVSSLQASFLFSILCGRRLLWTSVRLNMIHTFLSHKNPRADLSCVSQATQYSPSMESPKDIQIVNRLIVACLWQLPRALLQGNSAGLPRYECFAAGFSTYPCHMAFIPCLMTAFFVLRFKAIVRTFLATKICSGIFNLRKVFLLWYCFCWIPLNTQQHNLETSEICVPVS